MRIGVAAFPSRCSIGEGMAKTPGGVIIVVMGECGVDIGEKDIVLSGVQGNGPQLLIEMSGSGRMWKHTGLLSQW
jgi:hypothetical protein